LDLTRLVPRCFDEFGDVLEDRAPPPRLSRP
jgi:hypothetical protein